MVAAAEQRAPTQQARILDMLRLAGPAGITPLQALEGAQCMRLAAVVHRLKAEGHVIDTHMIETASGKHIARYVLVAPASGWVQMGLPL